ncbi:MAG: hypothetical protein JWN70_2029 [Planctomycetaceae bacterium]|nr:hypothetical protein [Planctomycetaceae bacterium]
MTEPDRKRDRKTYQVIILAIIVGLLFLYGTAMGLIDSFRVVAESSGAEVHDLLRHNR